MDNYIVLPGGEIRKAEVMEWAAWFEADIPMRPFAEGGRRVAYTELPGKGYVSTVFLGMDHNFMGGDPVLFETMVFERPGYEDHQERYHTHAEAAQGHARTVAMCSAEKP